MARMRSRKRVEPPSGPPTRLRENSDAYLKDFRRAMASGRKGEVKSCIRDWYEKTFGERPKYASPIPFCKLHARIGYEMIRRDYEQSGMEMPLEVKERHDDAVRFGERAMEFYSLAYLLGEGRKNGVSSNVDAPEPVEKVRRRGKRVRKEDTHDKTVPRVRVRSH